MKKMIAMVLCVVFLFPHAQSIKRIFNLFFSPSTSSNFIGSLHNNTRNYYQEEFRKRFEELLYECLDDEFIISSEETQLIQDLQSALVGNEEVEDILFKECLGKIKTSLDVNGKKESPLDEEDYREIFSEHMRDEGLREGHSLRAIRTVSFLESLFDVAKKRNMRNAARFFKRLKSDLYKLLQEIQDKSYGW